MLERGIEERGATTWFARVPITFGVISQKKTNMGVVITIPVKAW